MPPLLLLIRCDGALHRAAVVTSLCAGVLTAPALSSCAPRASEAGDGAVASGAIVGGEPATDDPGVVALLDDTGSLRCTGALVASRLVLTAAHCGTADVVEVCFGSALSTGSCIAAAGSEEHPDFSDWPALEHDLAVVRLAGDAPAPPIAVLEDDLDAVHAQITSVRLVGFGLRAPGDAAEGLQKRTGRARMKAVNDDNAVVVPDPATTCNGDSGGPVLATLGGREGLIGVVRSGTRDCSGPSRFTRIDVYYRSFLEPRLGPEDTPATAPGVR